jgi:hypothetical protein
MGSCALLAIYVLDRPRHAASVKVSLKRAHGRSFSDSLAWAWAVITRQSLVVWLVIVQCALLYGGFYTTLAFCT